MFSRPFRSAPLGYIPNATIDTVILLYLLLPYLKLGAVDLPNSSLPLELSFPALPLSLSIGGTDMNMLARYLRKADMTEILLGTFAGKGHGKSVSAIFYMNTCPAWDRDYESIGRR